MTQREKLIQEEFKRIKPYFDVIQQDKRDVVLGLIHRASFIKIQLEDYEDDLNKNGYTDKFTQSDKLTPYERERPTARLYNALLKSYQSIIRQLVDLLPEESKEDAIDEIKEWMI